MAKNTPASPTPSLSDYNDENVSREVAALDDLNINQLRVRWRQLHRSAAPHLPRYLLLRILAYRIQANAYGDLDRKTVRFLDQIATDWQARRAAGKIKPKAVPLIPPVPFRRSLKPGTILAREHGGALHRVMVLDDGFAWNGTTYRSLSEAAHAITGTKWNGPRFFGLRDRHNLQAAQPGAAS